MPVNLRDAEQADLAAICAIYNAEGIATTASYDFEERDESYWVNWLAGQRAAGYPCLVAEIDGRVLGYASYGPFRAKAGWAPTVEHSIYVSAAAQQRGLGRLLLTELLARASAAGVHTVVGVVDAGNEASMRLHAGLGFELMGVLREGGRKFDRWLDVAFWTIRPLATIES